MMISRYVKRGRLSKEAPVHLHEGRNDGNADGERALAFFRSTANTSLPESWQGGKHTHKENLVELNAAARYAKTVFNGMENFDLVQTTR